MKKYAATKPSGVEWLGDVPAHWEVKRLKFTVELGNTKTDDTTPAMPYVGLENIESWTGRRIEGDTTTEDSQGTIFHAGDVLFCKLRPYLAKAHLANATGACTSEALVLQTGFELLPEYLRYYLLNRDFIDAVDASTYGAKMPRASWEFIGNLLQLLPPLPEQRAIAAFLDERTAHLDGLIRRKEDLLKLLAEQRAALITRAVTRGLDAAVPLCDSGVPWLGQVPAHWEVKRLKFIINASLMYGANEAAEFDDPEWPRFVRITDVNEDGTLREETFKSLPPEVAEPYLLTEGDILLARSGATVGKSFKYERSWGIAAFAGYLIRARIGEQALPAFVALYLKSHSYWQWVNSSFIQATIQNLSAERYANLEVPLPPIDEQHQIVAAAAKHNKRIDQMTDITNREIAKLREYRAALITAAVTGRIDVRAAVVPTPEPALADAL